MKVHYLQHVPFEGLGSIEAQLIVRGDQISVTRLYEGDRLPALSAVDLLIVMGGPMGVDDEKSYPWMAAEKVFIKTAIDAGKVVLGICLGAQFIADALGAKVRPNPHSEIGWFPISTSEGIHNTVLENAIADGLSVFHWHGDTFEVPPGAISIGSSEACAVQGFVYGDRVIGLQFHLETTLESAQLLINNARHDLDDSRWVQTEAEIIKCPRRFSEINAAMKAVLDRLSFKASHD